MSLEAVPLASPDAAPSVPGEVLLAHPGVAEAAVVGVPDRFWGEVVGAVVRRAPEQGPGNSNGTTPEQSPSQADL